MTTTLHDAHSVGSSLRPSPLFQRTGALAKATGNFFAGITWRSFGYHLVMLFLTVLGFVYAVTAVSLGLSLAILVIGLPLAAAMLLGARYLGDGFRVWTNAMLDTRIPSPPPARRGQGFGGFVKTGLSDVAGWRSIAYIVIAFITGIFAFCVSVTFFAVGIGGVTYPLWYRYLPAQQISDGTWHRGAQYRPEYFIDTPPRILAQALICLVVLVWVWPLLNNSLARLQAVLAATLLGPTQGSIERHKVLLNQARSAEASAQRMRSIERDLHDITQAQLVAIAMKVGDAKERLAAGEEPEAVLKTLDSAHLTSKDALTDLRGLVQGIHPAALNDGLGTALNTLSSSSALGVRLETSLKHEISPAVEAVAYYAVAELLTNAAKHSGAREAQVRAWTDADRLYVTVVDQGHGGAVLRGVASLHGGGLDGVAERVASTGGKFDLQSPHGGPTMATITMPRILKV
ncbi:sensor histidine kinase [Timonella senegalensis]|uniref:sensor histidine kinase n=1 Tax=Timonella senegalensis TaxID=1465825 RepID=UPI0002ED3C94|nr:sensor histidine kinase [Timonella senegalensis]